MLAATGEQASSALLALALLSQGVAARSFAGWQVPVRTDSSYTRARIQSIDGAAIRAELESGRVVIVTGFQGVDDAPIATADSGSVSEGGSLIVAAADGVHDNDQPGAGGYAAIGKATVWNPLTHAPRVCRCTLE